MPPPGKPARPILRARLPRALIIDWVVNPGLRVKCRLRDPTGLTQEADNALPPLTLDGLRPHRRYEITIQTRNAAGSSPESDVLVGWTGLPPPSLPPLVHPWLRGGSIVIAWNVTADVADADDAAVITVEVGRDIQPAPGLVVVATGGLTGLWDDTTGPLGVNLYAVRLAATTPARPGGGDLSEWGPADVGFRIQPLPSPTPLPKDVLGLAFEMPNAHVGRTGRTINALTKAVANNTPSSSGDSSSGGTGSSSASNNSSSNNGTKSGNDAVHGGAGSGNSEGGSNSGNPASDNKPSTKPSDKSPVNLDNFTHTTTESETRDHWSYTTYDGKSYVIGTEHRMGDGGKSYERGALAPMGGGEGVPDGPWREAGPSGDGLSSSNIGGSSKVTFGTGQPQEPHASPSSGDVKLFGRSVPPKVDDVIRRLLVASGNSSADITSGPRRPADQARIMYGKIKQKSLEYSYKLYGSYGDIVTKVYDDNRNKEEGLVRRLMEDKINELGPSKVSSHMNPDYHTWDIDPASISDRARFEDTLKKFQETGEISKYLGPNTNPKDAAYHIEIRKLSIEKKKLR